MPQVKVSPRQFDAIQRELLRAESAGYGPEECAIRACAAARLKPPQPYEPMELVVDPTLADGDFSRGLIEDVDSADR